VLLNDVLYDVADPHVEDLVVVVRGSAGHALVGEPDALQARRLQEPVAGGHVEARRGKHKVVVEAQGQRVAHEGLPVVLVVAVGRIVPEHQGHRLPLVDGVRVLERGQLRLPAALGGVGHHGGYLDVAQVLVKESGRHGNSSCLGLFSQCSSRASAILQ